MYTTFEAFNLLAWWHLLRKLGRRRLRVIHEPEVELQGALVHEALAAVVALDRRVQLRADLKSKETAEAHARYPFITREQVLHNEERVREKRGEKQGWREIGRATTNLRTCYLK